MLQVIRYLQGYLTIKVWGFSPERFMNLCSNHKIFLWNIRNHGDYYTMNIRLKNFYRLKGFTRKTGTRVVITGRYGLPFLSVRAWKRKIFLLGLFGSLCFWIWMSGFIWAIEVNGNYYVTTDVFQDFLKENEIQTGMKKKNVDIEKLEEAIRTHFDIVTWTSAQIDGTRLLIQVKENDLIIAEKGETKEAQVEAGVDLVADKDGTIVSIVTRTGVPKVSAGTQIKRGDILVEGGVPIYNDDSTVKRYDFCNADADIILRCVYSFEEQIAEKYEKKIYTGREREVPFFLIGTKKFKIQVPGNTYENSDLIEEKRQLKLFDNYYLPVYIGENLVREYKIEEKIYTKEEVKMLFEERLQKFIQTLQEKGVQIIEKNVTINKTSGVWKMKVDFLAEEKTGTAKRTTLMQIEESPEPEAD
ncbi:MAG: sporulation protein YqfD [Suilimivivens sp.]|nr:sporulation protein YqfD [Lachnospiraceae bacterium]MDY5870964.1 sporulation protein YqfD [Lachnospiraceae bacterium]